MGRVPYRTARISSLFLKSHNQKTLIICVYLLHLIVLLNFDNADVVTFPKTENFEVLVTCKLTCSHFETHDFRNICNVSLANPWSSE